MPELQVQHVVSCSSADKNNPAENLLKADGSHKWRCAAAGEKNASVVLQLTKSSLIQSIDIGNEGSAFVEVLVGKATAAADTDFEVLLVASSFMSPLESRNGTNRTSVRMFGADKLNKAASSKMWDRVKVVCNQPFCKLSQYGLSFIKFHGPSSGEPEVKVKKFGSFSMKEDTTDDFKVGSLFANRSKPTESPLPPAASGAAALRAATRMVDDGRLMTSSSDVGPSQSSSPRVSLGGMAEAWRMEKKGYLPSGTFSSLRAEHQQLEKKDERLKVEIKEEKHTLEKRDDSCNEEKKKEEKRKEEKKKDEKKKESRKRQADSPPPQRSKPKVSRSSRSDSESHSGSDSDSGTDGESARPPRTKMNRQCSQASASCDSPSMKRSQTTPAAPSPARSLSEVMAKVTFVLSGFQNPTRGQLRDQALEMGAKYRPDWGGGCTHLVCAYSKTPKYQTVAGKGKIVTKSWVTDCYKKRQLLPWRRYRLGDAESPDEGSDEEEVETPKRKAETPSRKGETSKTKVETPKQKVETQPKKVETPPRNKSRSSTPEATHDVTDRENTKQKKDPLKKTGVVFEDSDSGDDTEDELRKAREIADKQKLPPAAPGPSMSQADEDAAYCGSTDEDDPGGSHADCNDSSDSGLPDLPDFLTDKHFFFYGDFPPGEQRLLTRYVAAYNGEIEDYMSKRVKYVITAKNWDDNFEEALNENPDLVFVAPRWIHQCHSKLKMVPYQPHIIVPRR